MLGCNCVFFLVDEVKEDMYVKEEEKSYLFVLLYVLVVFCSDLFWENKGAAIIG